MTIRLVYFAWPHPLPLATEFSILVFYELKAFEILTFRQYCSDEGFHYLQYNEGAHLAIARQPGTWANPLIRPWLYMCYKRSVLRRQSKRTQNARNVRLYYPYCQYTNLFIFRFVSLLCLRSTLRLYYIYIYIWSEIFQSPTGQKVKPNMADMETFKNILSPPFLQERGKGCLYAGQYISGSNIYIY